MASAAVMDHSSLPLPPPCSNVDVDTTTTADGTTAAATTAASIPNEHRFSFVKLKSKLGAAGHKLYGREQEEAILREAYYRTVNDCRQELILISGNQGVGKTALSSTLRTVVASKKAQTMISNSNSTASTTQQPVARPQQLGYFVAGKFEEQTVHEPYDVFITALTDYVDQVLDVADDAQLARIRESCQQACAAFDTADGDAGSFSLSDMVPALHRILGTSSNNETTGAGGSSTDATNFVSGNNNNNNNSHRRRSNYGTEAQNRFRMTFCDLIRALALTAPLVLFLDDLQWGDTASVELVRNLMLHSQPMPLLIVGAHRCDLKQPAQQAFETGDPTQIVCIACMQMKPFVATMQDLEKERHRLRMTSIDLKNLEANAVNVLLLDLLDHKTEHDTLPLAAWIIDQTDGNVFHILQFVRLLLDQGFLKKNDHDKWTWDSREFEKWTNSNNNINGGESSSNSNPTILKLVQKTMENLPRLAQEALKVASCLGDEIDDSALDLVLQTATSRHLELAASEGLLVFVPSVGGYRFAHDWIRQTAFEMTPVAERDEFHLKIGRKLWKSSSAAAMDKNIFVVVSLLNKGIFLMNEERERYRVAELNLRAAERAAAVSAFPDASKFARKGILLLSQNRWKSYYSLTLQLYSLASEVEAINGNYERVVMYIEDIVDHATCLEDKLRAYAALIRSMGQQDNVVEATTVGIDVLVQLGEPFPATPPTRFAIGKEFVKIKLALRGRSNQDLLNLPMMNDSIKIATLQMLNLVMMHSYKARSPYTPLLAFRAISITLRFGVHESSCVAFATYGAMLCGLGLDYKAGRRFGEVAISLADKLQSRDYTPMVHFVVGAGTHHWTAPITEAYEYLLHSSRLAMEIGDVEIAAMAKLTQIAYSFFNGARIEDCVQEMGQCVSTTRLYRKHSVELLSHIHLQLFECYQGKCPNPARLNGDSINFDRAMKECVDSNTLTWVASLYLYAMELAYAFHDYDYAAQMAQGNQDLEKAPSALFFTVENRYKEALIAIALARRGTNVGNNKKLARMHLKKMEKWAKNAPQNCRYKYLLLDAELKSLKAVTTKRKEKIYSIYEEAIRYANKMECRNEVALILERFADFKQECGDFDDAVALYRKSLAQYSDWGATAKVEHVNQILSSVMREEKRSL